MELDRTLWCAPAVRAGRRAPRDAPAAQIILSAAVVHHLSHSSRLLAPVERVAYAGLGRQSDGQLGWAAVEELQAGARQS